MVTTTEKKEFIERHVTSMKAATRGMTSIGARGALRLFFAAPAPDLVNNPEVGNGNWRECEWHNI